MIQQPEEQVEVFSWPNYRDERRKSEKEQRKSEKDGKKSKSKKDKKRATSKLVMPVDTSALDTSEPTELSIEKPVAANDQSFSVLDVDESGRTEPTMAESASTIESLQASSSNLHVAELSEDNVFDHFVLAAPEIHAAMMEFHEKTGVKPVKTGHINGLGITKARVAFEGSSFLEIIAPDPERDGFLGALIRSQGLTGLVPFHWAIRNSDARALSGKVGQMGYTPDFIKMKGAEQSEDGTPKKWESLYLYGHNLGGVCPYFIHWDTFDHPCETALPIVGNLLDVRVSAPSDDKVHELIGHTGSAGFTLEEGSPHVEVKFDSPNGAVSFAADEVLGFKIPGFEEAVDKAKAASAAPSTDQTDSVNTNTADSDATAPLQQAVVNKEKDDASQSGEPNKKTKNSADVIVKKKEKHTSKTSPESEQPAAANKEEEGDHEKKNESEADNKEEKRSSKASATASKDKKENRTSNTEDPTPVRPEEASESEAIDEAEAPVDQGTANANQKEQCTSKSSLAAVSPATFKKERAMPPQLRRTSRLVGKEESLIPESEQKQTADVPKVEATEEQKPKAAAKKDKVPKVPPKKATRPASKKEEAKEEAPKEEAKKGQAPKAVIWSRKLPGSVLKRVRKSILGKKAPSDKEKKETKEESPKAVEKTEQAPNSVLRKSTEKKEGLKEAPKPPSERKVRFGPDEVISPPPSSLVEEPTTVDDETEDDSSTSAEGWEEGVLMYPVE